MRRSRPGFVPGLRPWLVAGLLLACGCPARLLAQDDHAAGLFSAARQLPLVGQSMTVRLEGGDAVVELVQIFANDGEGAAQADYRLHLPAGATVAGFGFWRDGRFLAATLAERGQARAAHARAADEGRATGLLQQDGEVHSFSVFPLTAHSAQQIALTLRLPVVTERGRSHVRLPLDELLGGSPIACTVVALLRTPQPLAAFGVDGASFLLRGRGPRWAELVLSSEQPVEVWWSEQGPPLLAAAEVVPLEDGSFAVQLRLQLNRASEVLARARVAAPGAEAGPFLVAGGERPLPAEPALVPAAQRDLVLLIDGSFSMRRRAAAVAELVTRLVEAPPRARPRSLRLIAVGERTAEVTPAAAEELPRALLAADVGFHASWQEMAAAAATQGCAAGGAAATAPRCLAITDAQIDMLPPAAERTLATLFLADADELAYFGDALGPAAVTYQPDVDPRGKLFAFADTLVLPVLELRDLAQPGGTLELVGPPGPPVAEGGLLRVFGHSGSDQPLALRLTIDGHELSPAVPLQRLAADDEGGRALRRGYYAAVLGDWMAQYRKNADPELRQRIVDASLREGIPTDLTGLQVSEGSPGAMAATASPAPLLRRLGVLLLLLGAAAWALARRLA